jgi:hypothetical protein
MRYELRQALLSRWFLLAFLVMLAALFGLSVPEWFISWDWGTEYRQSALQQAIMPIFFGGTMLLFPFCACAAYASNQSEEIRTHFLEWKLLRGSTFIYARNKISANFIASGLSIAFAFLVHALIWRLIALPSDPIQYSAHEIPFAEDCIYQPWLNIMHGLPILLWMALGMAFMGGVWGTAGLAVAIWMPDPLLTISVPTFLYFLWNSSATSVLLGFRLPHAGDLYNDALTWPIVFTSLWVNLTLLLVLALIYSIGLYRRGHHA